MSAPRFAVFVLAFTIVHCASVAPPSAHEAQPTRTPECKPVSAPAAAAPAASASPAVVATPPAAPLGNTVIIGLKNPLAVPRVETISVRLSEALKAVPALQVAKLVVQGPGGVSVLSQLVDTDADGHPDELVFQTEFQPNESKAFLMGEGTRSTPKPDQYQVYGRFARERHDDFAWENDRTAHRMYGPELETWKADPLTSSGIDVWVKRTRRLVINEWYQTDDYHHDNGAGADFYSVGPSRGCGGVGFWDGKVLHASRNFTSTRVLANGPIRLVFELGYAPWDTGAGGKVSETKRVIVDAGQHFDRFESTFKVSGKPSPLTLAIGIAKHAGAVFDTDQPSGVLRSWEPFSADNGHLGCAVVSVSAPAVGFAETTTDRLLLTTVPSLGTAVYLAGSGWDKGGTDVPDGPAWASAVSNAASALRSPIQVTLVASTRQP